MRQGTERRYWKSNPGTQKHKSRTRNADCLIKSVSIALSFHNLQGGTTYKDPSSRPIHRYWRRRTHCSTGKKCNFRNSSRSSFDCTIGPNTRSHSMWCSSLFHKHQHRVSLRWFAVPKSPESTEAPATALPQRLLPCPSTRSSWTEKRVHL